MARYALIDPQNAINRLATDVDPTVATRAGWRWLPCPVVARPAYDAATQALDGPTYSVGADSVAEIWTVRDLTAAELDAIKDGQVNAISRIAFEVAFNHENRIRALEGKAAVTRPQFLAALKALL